MLNSIVHLPKSVQRTFEQILNDSLKADYPLIEFRDQIIKLRASGVEKQTILADLENMPHSANSENEEDIILEIMGLLAGYCSSHMRID